MCVMGSGSEDVVWNRRFGNTALNANVMGKVMTACDWWRTVEHVLLHYELYDLDKEKLV